MKTATLALIASRNGVAAFHLFVLIAMIAQVIWRGLSTVIAG